MLRGLAPPLLVLFAASGPTRRLPRAPSQQPPTPPGHHPQRLRILERLDARGPTTLSRLAAELGLDRTSVRYHLRRLGRVTSIVFERRAGHLVISLPGQDTSGVIASPGTRARDAVLQTLRAAGGALPRSDLLARLAWMPARTRNHALSALIESGLLRREWDERGETVRVREHGGRIG